MRNVRLRTRLREALENSPELRRTNFGATCVCQATKRDYNPIPGNAPGRGADFPRNSPEAVCIDALEATNLPVRIREEIKRPTAEPSWFLASRTTERRGCFPDEGPFFFYAGVCVRCNFSRPVQHPPETLFISSAIRCIFFSVRKPE